MLQCDVIPNQNKTRNRRFSVFFFSLLTIVLFNPATLNLIISAQILGVGLLRNKILLRLQGIIEDLRDRVLNIGKQTVGSGRTNENENAGFRR